MTSASHYREHAKPRRSADDALTLRRESGLGALEFDTITTLRLQKEADEEQARELREPHRYVFEHAIDETGGDREAVETAGSTPQADDDLPPWPGRYQIPTHSGQLFDLTDPESFQWNIDDVAYSLAHLVRFTGHARGGYSVAQHSVLASFLVPEELAYEALMHDGHESVVGDCASPLKRLLSDYQAVEARVQRAFRQHFCVSVRDSTAVERADAIMCATEFRDVMAPVMRGHRLPPEFDGIEPMEKRIRWVWPPFYARWRFRRRFDQLSSSRGHGRLS